MDVLFVYRMAGMAELKLEFDKYKNDNKTIVVTDEITKNWFRAVFDCQTFTVAELLKGDLDRMKFDYITGNPPYQAPSTDKKVVGSDIWKRIIKKVFPLLKEDGTMTMLTPKSGIIRRGQPSIIERLATEAGFKITQVDYTADNHFPNVGTAIIGWTAKANGKIKSISNQGTTDSIYPIEDKMMLEILFKTYKKPNDTFFQIGDKKVTNSNLRSSTKTATHRFKSILNHRNDNVYYLECKDELHGKNKLIIKTSAAVNEKELFTSVDTYSEFYQVRDVSKNSPDEIEQYKKFILSLNQIGKVTLPFEQGKCAYLGRIPNVNTKEEVYEHFEFTPKEIEFLESL